MKHRIPALCRHAALAGATATGIALSATPLAHADGYGGDGANCSNTPAACTVYAQSPGGQDTGSGYAASGAHGAAPGRGGPPPQVTCTDTPFTPTPADLATLKQEQPTSAGHWVMRSCTGPVLVPWRMLTWVPNGTPAVPDPRVLAAQAVSKLILPNPAIESSPGGGAPQTVELPTWAWLPKAQWAPLSATASVPGESVTATATPRSVTWSWGDGTSTVCPGPGTPYVKGVSDPAAASPDCGHTYRQTSAAAPHQQYPVTATLAWSVAWNGGGQSGTFLNLTTMATAHWIVRQIQSLIVNQ